jgi:hypothetical protein
LNREGFSLIESPAMPTVMKKHIAKLCSMLSVTPVLRIVKREQALSKLATVFVVMTTLATTVSFAGTVAAPYEIGTWQGFRAAAISYTCDGSYSNQYSLAEPMFNAAGLKFTLMAATGSGSGFFHGWTDLQTAANYGHEIGSLTVDHISFFGMDPPTQEWEMTNSQDAINANITNQQCVSLALPYCGRGDDSLIAQYYIAARGCGGPVNPSTPTNMSYVQSFVCGTSGALQTFQNFTNQAVGAASSNGWCVYLIHGIDNDGGYSLASTTLQATVNFFSTNQNTYWVQTFGHVARYLRERNDTSVAVITNQTDSFAIRVTDTLDNSLYNYPITLRLPQPTNWTTYLVSQSNSLISAQTVTVNSTNYLMFDVVPNGGDVLIQKVPLPFNISNPVMTDPSSFTFHLDGQANVPYVITYSTNLKTWGPVQTNILSGTSTNLTFAAPNRAQFYRVYWSP